MSTDLPSVKSAWEDPALQADKKLADLRQAARDRPGPAVVPDVGAGHRAFDTEMEKVTKNGADPAAALKTVQQQAESIGTGQ